jgi:hypothetical protein
MSQYRNGLDHAWTGDKTALPRIPENGQHFYGLLTKVIHMLQEHHMIC